MFDLSYPSQYSAVLHQWLPSLLEISSLVNKIRIEFQTIKLIALVYSASNKDMGIIDLWKQEFRSSPSFFLTRVSLKKTQSKYTVRLTSFQANRTNEREGEEGEDGNLNEIGLYIL